LTVVILLASFFGGVATYLWAFDEAIEMQDSTLIQIGSLLQNGAVKSDAALHGIDADAEVNVIELGTAPHGPAEVRRLWSLQDGLRVAMLRGQPVRILLRTRGDESRFALTQQTDVRDDIAGNMAFRTLLPIAALVPCMLVVTALVVAGSLRPMVHLAGDLDACGRHDAASADRHAERAPSLHRVDQ
jgi:two-component system, OmpR family, sensor kinase